LLIHQKIYIKTAQSICMKVLFVCSGKVSGAPGILIRNQGESLKNLGIIVDYFTIERKGVWGYLQNIRLLGRYLKSNNYNIVHAHYSLCGFMASLAYRGPIIVSLMGSEVHSSILLILSIKLFHRLRWNRTIVKTSEMKDKLQLANALVIPNGVNLNEFVPMEKSLAKKRVGYGNRKSVIFVADPGRVEKNFALARLAIGLLKRNDVDLVPLFNIGHNEIKWYMNAADALLLTSIWEGSVNVVKEAMACNIPIVSTDVGDVRMNTTGVSGCYICENNAASLASGLEKALQFDSETNGRERIISLGLDSEAIGRKIVAVYEEIIRQ
jgi:teichuronic acid biosynthesis glycosyltransferase TuaC